VSGGRDASHGFVPPPYPYERLDHLLAVAAEHPGGAVDLSIGTPCDPPPAAVVEALATSGTERGYPASIGSAALRAAAARWMQRRLDVDVDPEREIAACVGTKEFVATLPHYLALRDPSRDTVLYPRVSYPTYEMGAVLARCRAVAYDDLDHLADVSDEDASRALCVWVNAPANPTGAIADLRQVAAWGRNHGVPVFSDECYVEYTWDGPRRTILEDGVDGVVAVHSLSKRSNMAGLRAGFFAGDPTLVQYLREVRKHVGMMVAGPVQAAAVAALGDDAHVEEQRGRYRERLTFFRDVLRRAGAVVELPPGSFYLWAEAPDGDAWAFTERFAKAGGVLVAPGDLYGEHEARHVRVAMVAPMDRLELAAERLGS
jgi:succinyldiaminopimelate transaminase